MALNTKRVKLLLWFQMRMALETGCKVKEFSVRESCERDRGGVGNSESISMSLELGCELNEDEVKKLKKVDWNKEFDEC